MKSTNRTLVTKDHKENSILVSRVFNAPIEKVWQAHTDNTGTELEKIVEMGFEQGITICHDQLESLLKG